jgi:hypothetical protein
MQDELISAKADAAKAQWEQEHERMYEKNRNTILFTILSKPLTEDDRRQVVRMLKETGASGDGEEDGEQGGRRGGHIGAGGEDDYTDGSSYSYTGSSAEHMGSDEEEGAVQWVAGVDGGVGGSGIKKQTSEYFLVSPSPIAGERFDGNTDACMSNGTEAEAYQSGAKSAAAHRSGISSNLYQSPGVPFANTAQTSSSEQGIYDVRGDVDTESPVHSAGDNGIAADDADADGADAGSGGGGATEGAVYVHGAMTSSIPPPLNFDAADASEEVRLPIEEGRHVDPSSGGVGGATGLEVFEKTMLLNLSSSNL